MEHGITLVDRVENSRSAMGMEAIYFLTPTAESIKAMVDDFKDKKKPKYSAAHLFTTSRIPGEVFDLLKGPIVDRLKTLKELNLEYLATEPQSFHFDSPRSLSTLFAPNGGPSLRAEYEETARRLVTLCATLGDYPLVRFSRKHTVAGKLAAMVSDQLDTFARSVNDFPVKTSREPTTLLILDRSVDPLAPLLHEFTYQAMIYDLLEVDRDVYRYKSDTGFKEMLLNDSDELFMELRHRHIAECIETVIGGFKEFAETNKVASGLSDNASLSEMRAALRGMPEYRERVAKYERHIEVANALMGMYSDSNLENVALLEQDMATGRDVHDQKVKNPVGRLQAVLRDPKLTKTDRLRLLMIYLASQEGISEEDRRRLEEVADLSASDKQAWANLFLLGVSLAKAPVTAKGFFRRKTKNSHPKRTANDVSYDVSRYRPLLQNILDELTGGTLGAEEYPYVKAPPDLDGPSPSSPRGSANSGGNSGFVAKLGKAVRSSQPRWSQKTGSRKEEEVKKEWAGGRLIVFIAGGMTYSEMRTVYEVSKATNREILIGGNSVLTPSAYVAALREVRQPESF